MWPKFKSQILNKYLGFGYKGLVFCSLPKWMLINWPKIPQMLQNLFAQIVCPKFAILMKKGLHWASIVCGFIHDSYFSILQNTTFTENIIPTRFFQRYCVSVRWLLYISKYGKWKHFATIHFTIVSFTKILSNHNS